MPARHILALILKDGPVEAKPGPNNLTFVPPPPLFCSSSLLRDGSEEGAVSREAQRIGAQEG